MNTDVPYPYTTDQNVVRTGTSEGPLNQIVLTPHYEPNASNINGAAQTVFLSQDHNVYPNSRYSPPPSYDSCQVFNPCVQPTQYQQIQLPQQQNVQYIHQQRLQYPQQESLQCNEGIPRYLPQQRMPYPYQRYRDFPDLCKPPIKRNSCNNCFIYCCVYGWFCVLPICILIYLLFYCSSCFRQF